MRHQRYLEPELSTIKSHTHHKHTQSIPPSSILNHKTEKKQSGQEITFSYLLHLPSDPILRYVVLFVYLWILFDKNIAETKKQSGQL